MSLIIFQKRSHLLSPIGYSLVVLFLLLLSACQREDNPPLSDWYGPTTGYFTATIVSKLKNDLVDTGLSKTQATVIKVAAILKVNGEGASGSTDIGVIAPLIVEGAENAISNSDAALSNNEKITTLNTIAASVTESINDKVVSDAPAFIRAIWWGPHSRQN